MMLMQRRQIRPFLPGASLDARRKRIPCLIMLSVLSCVSFLLVSGLNPPAFSNWSYECDGRATNMRDNLCSAALGHMLYHFAGFGGNGVDAFQLLNFAREATHEYRLHAIASPAEPTAIRPD
mmetsp:Transcript_875/g.1620  ORF Transcript_875/g.1620 Transcript_875/m.1620 type:complete len:122 (-) Transcript_875:41-406(-)